MNPSVPEDPPHKGALEPLRERAVEALIEAFARDQLHDHELEERLDRAHRAASVKELKSLLQELPGGAAALVPRDPRGASSPAPQTGGASQGVSVASEERIRPRQTLIGIWGGSVRKGNWRPARNIDAIAVMGGVDLDFREAIFPPGVTTIRVFALMGGVDILLPPGVGLQCEVMGIMGGADAEGERPPPPGAPTVRVTGLALMGGVDVKVRPAGMTAREARRLKKEEARRRLRNPEGRGDGGHGGEGW